MKTVTEKVAEYVLEKDAALYALPSYESDKIIRWLAKEKGVGAGQLRRIIARAPKGSKLFRAAYGNGRSLGRVRNTLTKALSEQPSAISKRVSSMYSTIPRKATKLDLQMGSVHAGRATSKLYHKALMDVKNGLGIKGNLHL